VYVCMCVYVVCVYVVCIKVKSQVMQSNCVNEQFIQYKSQCADLKAKLIFEKIRGNKVAEENRHLKKRNAELTLVCVCELHRVNMCDVCR